MSDKTYRDRILSYALIAHRRFYKKEKIKVLNLANQEFKAMGYATALLYPDHAKGEAVNLLIGDVRQARTIVVSAYDTPIKSFGLFPYEPFDIKNYKRKYLSSVLIPLLIICLICFVFSTVFMRFDLFTEGLTVPNFIVLLFYLLGIATIIHYSKGIPNAKNFNRNSSGVIALFELAERLSNQPDASVAFVLTDHGSSNHLGDIMLKEYLGVQETASKTFLVLDTIGMGDTIGINYSPPCKTLISQITSDGFNIRCYPEDNNHFSIAHIYPRSIYLSCTFNAQPDAFTITRTSSSKDIDIDLNCLEHVTQLAMTLIKRNSR